MQENWSLKELYPGFDSPEFQRDWKALPGAIEAIVRYTAEQFTAENAADTAKASAALEGYIKLELDFEPYVKLPEFTSLFLAVNTTDETALKFSDRLEEIFAELTPASTGLKGFLRRLPDLDAVIAGHPLLEQHRFFLFENREMGMHVGSDAEELLLSKLQPTGSSAWGKLYELLTSTLLVDITLDGKEQRLPLSMARNLAYSPDAAVRKTAYEAELAAYPKVEKSIAASLNAIKGEALTIAQLRNYDSVLDMTLLESRMDRETLDALWGAIGDYLPSFHSFLRAKAKLLGHQNGLPFYDLFAPMGEVEMQFTYPQAADYVVKTFSDFSDKLGAFARNAFDTAWIDAFPREGKRGGAFCSNLHAIGQSRIMANFSGSFDGMSTFAHELGHAYHGDCLREETALNCDYTMPIAETASTFCETLVTQSALKTATEEETFAILENYLSGITQVTADIYSRFLFEDAVINGRKEGSLSPDELKGIMLDAQKKAYGDGLDHSLLHPYMWACKPHYYEVSVNYYNFPYAYGQLFALGLYARYLEEGKAFLPKFDALLASTGKNNLRDVGLQAGIDIRDKAFWAGSLETVKTDVERFLALVENRMK